MYPPLTSGGDATPHQGDHHPSLALRSPSPMSDPAHFCTQPDLAAPEMAEGTVLKRVRSPLLSSDSYPQPGLYRASRCIGRTFSLCCKMGRKLSPEETNQRAQANGYVFAAHHEEDSQQAPTSFGLLGSYGRSTAVLIDCNNIISGPKTVQAKDVLCCWTYHFNFSLLTHLKISFETFWVALRRLQSTFPAINSEMISRNV